MSLGTNLSPILLFTIPINYLSSTSNSPIIEQSKTTCFFASKINPCTSAAYILKFNSLIASSANNASSTQNSTVPHKKNWDADGTSIMFSDYSVCRCIMLGYDALYLTISNIIYWWCHLLPVHWGTYIYLFNKFGYFIKNALQRCIWTYLWFGIRKR